MIRARRGVSGGRLLKTRDGQIPVVVHSAGNLVARSAPGPDPLPVCLAPASALSARRRDGGRRSRSRVGHHYLSSEGSEEAGVAGGSFASSAAVLLSPETPLLETGLSMSVNPMTETSAPCRTGRSRPRISTLGPSRCRAEAPDSGRRGPLSAEPVSSSSAHPGRVRVRVRRSGSARR
jgi:hypothetical protein